MKRFSDQFKDKAVRIVLDQGRPVPALSKELGIHENTLYRWIALYRVYKEHAGSDHSGPKEEELNRLKRTIADLQEEKAVLIKFLGFFFRLYKLPGLPVNPASSSGREDV